MYKFSAELQTDNLEALKRVALSRGWQEEVPNPEQEEGSQVTEMIDNPETMFEFFERDFPKFMAQTYLNAVDEPEVQEAKKQATQAITEASLAGKQSLITCNLTEE